jgi:hypothetical protein
MSKPVDCSGLGLGESFDRLDDILARNEARLRREGTLSEAIRQARDKRRPGSQPDVLILRGAKNACIECDGQGSRVERADHGVTIATCGRCGGRGMV